LPEKRDHDAGDGRDALLCAELHRKPFALTPSKEITMFALSPTEQETLQASTKDLAERCLRSNPYLALKSVSCDYLDGVLFLRGRLPTYYLKQLAQEVVGGLEGVERIDNQIQVVTPAFRSGQG
jgi:hypothetical protein